MDRITAVPFFRAAAAARADVPALARIADLVASDADAAMMAPFDPQLADYSWEWRPGKGIEPVVRCSYFGTSRFFFARVAREFGFSSAPDALEAEMARHAGKVKDGSVQCGFVLSESGIVAIKAYFDVVDRVGKPGVCARSAGFRPATTGSGEVVTLVACTFGQDGLSERKAYYPCRPGDPSVARMLERNPAFAPFRSARPYDVLFRVDPSGTPVGTVKLYYYFDENPGLERPIARLFSGCRRPNFPTATLRTEAGIEFFTDGGIAKVDYYFGHYKRRFW